jgi:cobalt-zinc-cadmium efflux system outer membrane protein
MNIRAVKRSYFGHQRSWLVALLIVFVFRPVQTVTAQTSASPKFDPSDSHLSSPAASRNFSLEACFDSAEANNKEIISAKWNLLIAQSGIKIAGAIPNPQLNIQTGFGPSFTQLYTGQTQLLGLTEQFLTAGKRQKRIEVARANLDLAEAQLNALRFDVHNRVRRAYAELAAAEAYQALIEAQRAVGFKLLSIAQRRFEAGKAPKSEVLQAELNVSQFDTQRNQAQGRLQQDSTALALLIGEKPSQVEVIDVDDNGLFKLSAEKTEIVPSPTRALPALFGLLKAASNTRYDLKAAEDQVSVNRRSLTLAKAQRIPDLFVGSGYTFSTFARSQPGALVPQPNWLGEGVQLTVSSENPLFYQHQGEVQNAIGNLRQAERSVDLLKSQIASDLVTSYNEVSVAKANIFLFQRNLLPTAAEVARLARRGYEVGATDLAAAILAQQQYQQTLSSYFDGVVAYQSAWADLEKAVGAPLQI